MNTASQRATRALRALALVAASAAFAADSATNQTLQLSPVPDWRGARAGPAFQIVLSDAWPTGLVPIFGPDDGEPFELRRLPPRGLESFTEPLFFALPPEEEPRAADIAGRWTCVTTNAQRSRHEPHWELAVEGERLAGRFGQQGEYRVASITGGTFRSNRFELAVEWINDRYQLTGDWRAGKLQGTWRQLDESEHGAWFATRDPALTNVAAGFAIRPLYEWRLGERRRYSIETTAHDGEWRRAVRPLCRVWVALPGK